MDFSFFTHRGDMRFFRLTAFALVASGLAIATGPARAATGSQPETFVLDNGMEVVVLPDHRAPVVTHMVWYRVGAADEAPGKSGIAHLFEHLMFKATDEIPAGEFSKIVARNGGQDNAFTSWDYTAYFQRVAKDRLETMMEMEANRMTDLLLTDEEVLPERDVVKEERRQRTDNNPGSLLFEKVMAALYDGHPYAIPVIGFMDEVAELTRQDALDFYEEWYGPEDAILVVAGDITAAELKPLATRIYGSIDRKSDGTAREWPDVKPLEASRAVSHSDPKVRQPEWSRYWLGTSYSLPDAGMDPYALDVAMEILGGGRTSRLYQALVEEQGVAVNAYAFAWTTLKAGGPVGVSASPSPGTDLDTLAPAVEDVVAEFLKTGPTDAELARAKSNLRASAIFERDSQASMAQTFGSARARGETLESVVEWPSRIETVSSADVMSVSRKYLSKNHVSARLLPESGEN